MSNLIEYRTIDEIVDGRMEELRRAPVIRALLYIVHKFYAAAAPLLD